MIDIICTKKEKNTGIFIFQAQQNGVKHIIKCERNGGARELPKTKLIIMQST